MVEATRAPETEQRGGLRRTRREAGNRIRGERVVSIVSLVVIVALAAVPLAMLVISSVRATGQSLPFDSTAHFTLQNFPDIFNHRLPKLLWNTTLFTAGSLVVTMGLGIALAWIVERTDVPFQGFFYALIVAPFAIPGVILSIAWVFLLDPGNGAANVVLRSIFGLHSTHGPLNVYSLPTIIVIQGILQVPISFLMCAAAFRAMDPSHEAAAAVAGASTFKTVRTIVLPVLKPTIAAIVIFQFVTIVQAFDVPAVLGRSFGFHVLSTEVQSAIAPSVGLPNYGIASVYAILLLVVSLAPLLWYYRLIRRTSSFATISGKAYRPSRVKLGWKRFLAVGLVLLYLMFAFVLPLLTMAWTSFQPFYRPPSIEAFKQMSFKSYDRLWSESVFHHEVFDTLIVAIVSASIMVLLAVIEAWVVVRIPGRISRLVDLIAFFTHALPGVVIGISLYFFFLTLSARGGISIYDTVWVMVIGLVVLGIGVGTRMMVAATIQVHPELEEAASVSGSRWATTMRRIVMPLLRPAIVNVWLIGFVVGMINLSMTVILQSSHNGVLSVELYSRWVFGDVSAASAIGVMLVAVGLIVSLALRRWVSRTVG